VGGLRCICTASATTIKIASENSADEFCHELDGLRRLLIEAR